jgi:hypothetical protein
MCNGGNGVCYYHLIFPTLNKAEAEKQAYIGWTTKNWAFSLWLENYKPPTT